MTTTFPTRFEVLLGVCLGALVLLRGRRMEDERPPELDINAARRNLAKKLAADQSVEGVGVCTDELKLTVWLKFGHSWTTAKRDKFAHWFGWRVVIVGVG